MSLGVLILLLILGVIFVIAEVFFVSLGVLSMLAAACLISAIFFAYTQHSEAAGHILLVSTAVIVPITVWLSLRWLPHTRIGRAMLLPVPDHDKVTHAAEDPEIETLLGRTGTTESMLRPSGVARIDGRRVSVVTRGEMLDPGEPVEVIRIDGNRVLVRRVPDEAST